MSLAKRSWFSLIWVKGRRIGIGDYDKGCDMRAECERVEWLCSELFGMDGKEGLRMLNVRCGGM